MRLVSVQRGYDPRDFTLVSFGGAGPVHANQLARELGIPQMLVPPSPGVASALGMLATNVRHDYRTTRRQRLDEACPGDLEALFQELETRAAGTLQAEGFQPDRIRLQRSLDLRYVGQSWKLSVECHGHAALDPGRLKAEFDRQHKREYGYAVAEEPVEIVNAALSAQGMIRPLAMREAGSEGHSVAREGGAGAPPLRGAGAGHPENGTEGTPTAEIVRPVYFREAGGFAGTPIYDRYALPAGAVIEGPAIVAEMDATTVIHPGYHGRVIPFGILSIEAGGAGA
jgi:N-methylhydantoinase A